MLNPEKPFGKGCYGKEKISPEQVIVKLLEAEIIESRGLAQVEVEI